MKRAFIIAVALLAGGCYTRMHCDYFEASGVDLVDRLPRGAPRLVAELVRDGCELQVRAVVSPEDIIVISLRAFIPHGGHATFAGNQATVRVDNDDVVIALSWQEWTLHDGIGSRREVAFDAPLKPQSFARKPTRTGIEQMGRYETSFSLPDRYASVRDFSLVLPSPGDHPPILLMFTRKTVNHLVSVQLQ